MMLWDCLRAMEDFEGMEVVTADAGLDDILTLPGEVQEVLVQFITGLTYATKSSKRIKDGKQFTMGVDRVELTIPTEIWEKMTKAKKVLRLKE